MSEMISERPLSREQLYALGAEIRRTQEPYIQLLVDLYAVSLPTILVADGVVTTTYSVEVETEATKIRQQMCKAVELVVRYRLAKGETK